jgi:hypothetical protein
MGNNMQDATKTTLTDLLLADSSQVNSLLTNSVDEVIEINETSTSRLTPPRIGQYWPGQGGIYAGIIRDGENQWHLLLGSETIEPVCANDHDRYSIKHCAFKGTWGAYPNKIAGEFSRNDGQHNTALILAADPDNYLANAITSLSIDGHADYYWPAQCENNLLFINLRDQLAPQRHCSSTQHSAHGAWGQHFEGGYQSIYDKYDSLVTRAVRRFPIQSFAI